MNQKQQDIDEHLLLQYLQGNADKTLRTNVEAWLNAEGGNRKHLDRLESLWLETGRIRPVPVAVDVEAAWNNMMSRIGTVEAEPVRVRNIRSSRMYWAAAASILLIAGILFALMMFRGPGKIQLTSLDKVIKDTLPDGSKITLNSHSTLTCPAEFDKKSRHVTLTGDAYFEVKHDPLQPFIIDAGAGKIRVLGTSFRVNTRPRGANDPVRMVEVSVTSGRVLLYKLEKRSGDTISLILGAGETGVMKEGSANPVRLDTIAPDGLFWANQSLEFRATPLTEVFSLLQKYFSITIAVENQEILNCQITASFVNEPADKILAVIAESFDLKVETHGKHYQLSGNGCRKDAK